MAQKHDEIERIERIVRQGDAIGWQFDTPKSEKQTNEEHLIQEMQKGIDYYIKKYGGKIEFLVVWVSDNYKCESDNIKHMKLPMNIILIENMEKNND